ncbi:hypothetical protein B9Z35_05595 [Limnohabitans sp. Jir61]|uniref:hypothetical protein n=1 Tax=Limnohabitans sp. Jir61 TaxID=1826168 RepID=UPI000D33BCB6|nr:hypothetical protein [Limnohabitans sp. Jir61]PUE32996.1 hypothetical protein B9Z35_05595 [Limnohabitans sp. Jir61]
MDEYLLEIRYLVDDLGDIEIDNGLVRLERMRGFEYVLMIHLPGAYYKTEDSSTLSILHDNKKLFSRVLSSFECRLVLEAVSTIKFSFDSSENLTGKDPQDSYSVSLKRGTAIMSFAWADGEHITNDAELLSSLMKLVELIGDLEPIDYEGFGFEFPVKL